MNVFCLHFTPASGPILVGFLSRSSDTLADSLRSGVLCENHSNIFVIYLSEKLCKSDSDSCTKSGSKFPP